MTDAEIAFAAMHAETLAQIWHDRPSIVRLCQDTRALAAEVRRLRARVAALEGGTDR